MKHHTDHNGKSKAASSADAQRYPEQQGAPNESISEPAHDEIAERAHELWQQRGCPEGTAEQDWFEAAEQLRAKSSRAAR